MRRLLRLLNFFRRAPTENPDRKSARPVTAKGNRQQRPAGAQPARSHSVTTPPKSAGADRKRDRWKAPELEGPEFGGLIERRGADKRGLMPEPWKPAPDPQYKPRKPSQLGTDPGHVNLPADEGEGADPESTGVFLAALENSAITLADSGLFKMAEEPEFVEKDISGFDPYDHDERKRSV